jgi:RNA polymerase sigma-70 factor (family 1)
MWIAIMKEYQSYNNQILLNLLAENDEVAFTELYNRYWKKLFAIAYSRLNETAAAEDIVHDVFVSLWTNREKNQIQSLENYLATATKYMVLAKIKAKLRERVYTRESQQATVFELPVEDSLHYKRILEIVKTEIEKLPEKCRLIFNYSRIQGKQVKQIAKELNLSPKTVENQLNKALKQLKLATRIFLNSFLLIFFACQF